MKVRIYLKNGQTLPDIECEGFTVKRDRLTARITGYEFKRAVPPRPLYVEIDQILAVVRME